MSTEYGPMTQAVKDALAAAHVAPRDRAAAQLAGRYAVLLDDLRDTDGEVAGYSDIGPKLLATLTALGLTPAGRGQKGGGPSVAPVATVLDELRARRESRAKRAVGEHDSTPVDAAPTPSDS